MAKNIPGMLIILIIYHSATILSTKTGFTSPDVRQRSESCVKSVWLVLHCELPLQWCVRLPYSVYATIPSLPHPSLNPSYRWAHRQGLFQDYRQWHAQWLHAGIDHPTIEWACGAYDALSPTRSNTSLAKRVRSLAGIFL